MRQSPIRESLAPNELVGAEKRAPLAAAAVLGILAGGAAFLAYAMSRPAYLPNARWTEAPTLVASPAQIEAAPVASPPEASGEDPSESEAGAAALDPDTAIGGPIGVKPPIGEAVTTPPAPGAAPVMTLASPFVATVDDRPPPFFFEADLLRESAPRFRPALGGDGDIVESPREMRIALNKGENFVEALARAGVRAADRNEAAYALGKLYNMRRLRPSQEFALTLAGPNQTLFQSISSAAPTDAFLIALEFQVDAENRIALTRAPGGGYDATEHATPLTTRIAGIAGRIDGSLYLSAKRQGAPDEVIAGLAQMFAYDVDFQREIFGGDEFEAIFEVRYDEAGKVVGGGDILFGRLKWRGRQKEKGYYLFKTADGGGKADFFDENGESARRLLMKTPIDGARLSSGFGTRKHPILGYQKAHKGVDFAAARGTPIMAAGDGVVERAGPYGSFGNYVRIRHAQGYKTAYAHMNAIRKGVRTGVRVRQGDIIGTVGSTGRSTGPHLHYEVHLKDKPVNPQSLKIATGYELGGKELSRFKETRDRINAMRSPYGASTSLVAGANSDTGAF